MRLENDLTTDISFLKGFSFIENRSGKIGIIPKPELRGFLGHSLTKPLFKVTSAEVVIIWPDR